MSTCSSCGALIVWCRTETGKRIPVDAEPVVDGNLFLDGDQRLPTARSAARAGTEGKQLYRSHFSSCPDADRHRRRRATAPDLPPPHQYLFGE